MKSKRKRGERNLNNLLQELCVYITFALFILYVLGMCTISTQYQFDGVAPCTPESPVCITEMAR